MIIPSALCALFQDKKVLVVGLGFQGGGSGVIRFVAQWAKQVTVTDKKTEAQLHSSITELSGLGIQFHCGGHILQDFLEADCIIKGPSVPWNMAEIELAKVHNIPIYMEAALFVEFCPLPAVGITGTRGKSTTTEMIWEIMNASGKKAIKGGNMPGKSTLELFAELAGNDYVVLELSSYQLSGFHHRKISPHIAVVTNFYPDHLNYYQTLDEYWSDKTAIYRYQTSKDILIADATLKQSIEKDKPTSQQILIRGDEYHGSLVLPGKHNRSNASLAYSVGKILGISEAIIEKTLSKFTGLPFRQQKIAESNGVVFINDSTSTTPVALSAAIRTFGDQPVYLIAGGNSKHLPWEFVIRELQTMKRIFWLRGTWTDEVYPLLCEQNADLCTKQYLTLSEAVADAYKEAKQTGGVVLFSPGATSFATFINEFDRARQFTAAVTHIIAEQ